MSIVTSRLSLTFAARHYRRAKVAFSHYVDVATRKGPMPDPIVPWSDRSEQSTTKGAKSRSLHCEIYVPHDATAGPHEGTLTLRWAGQTVELAVSLQVWDFTLPDHLSFLPEMNCYGLPDDERAYYRLAHRNRTVLNRVPYSQNGTMASGCAPALSGKTLDWKAWDQRFGPYFDGSAFADLPRKNVPDRVLLPAAPRELARPHRGELQRQTSGPTARFPWRTAASFVDASRQFAPST